jgi:hypothetical protein
MNQTTEIGAAVCRAQFERDGCLVLPGYFSPEQIDNAASGMGSLLDGRPGEVVADSLKTGRRTLWSQADGQDALDFKFKNLYRLSEELRDVALEAGLASTLEGLLGEQAVLCDSVNLQRGSARTIHIDSLYTPPRMPHAQVAAWIALEDVHPDAGPLVYFPGSHRIPLYRFNDGTHRAAPEEEADWFDYIDVQIRLRRLKERRLLARKGDVLIRHGDLVHGSSPIRDASRTLRSMTCQYFGEGACRQRDMDLVPLNGGFWMRRLRQPARFDPVALGLPTWGAIPRYGRLCSQGGALRGVRLKPCGT